MLIHGDPSPPDQIGMEFPSVRYALVMSTSDEHGAILHAVGCAVVAQPPGGEGMRVSETVYSTTYDEIHEYAMRQYGDEGEGGWATCHVCRGVSDMELRRWRSLCRGSVGACSGDRTR